MATQNMAIKQRRKWHHVFPSWAAAWMAVVCLCLLNPAQPEVIYRVDPLALLAATLRTYQRAGCDSEQLALSCPRGTSISIELAQYGRAGDLSDHSLCPPVTREDLTTSGNAGDSVVHSGTEIEVKPPETCTVSGLQYVLLQTVVDACQKKRHCKFAASPKMEPGPGDPCAGIRKFVEIAYKCRPYEFRSKVACENDNMPLVCNPYSRIAIYSASFGHTERENVQCGQGAAAEGVQDNGRQTCLVSYATETVMQICHGRRRCSITADAGTFGRPCRNDVPMYLKVVYTCIPRKVLKDRYETAAEADEPQQSELDLDQDELYDEDQFYKESEAIPPAPKLQGAIPNPVFPYDFGLSADSSTSTATPPVKSPNDSSLEVRLHLAWMHSQAKHPSSQDPTTAWSTTTAASVASGVDDAGVGGNFFHRRKCQMEDDWGPIGLNCTEEDIVTERVEVIGFLTNWMQAYAHIRKNQEQFYLYLIISVAIGVLICLTLVIGRLTLQRRRTQRKNSGSCGSNSNSKHCDPGAESMGGAGAKYQPSPSRDTHLPNSFGDDVSDIDADIDLTTPMSVPSLSSRNDTYMTYVPTSHCTYGTLMQPQSQAQTQLQQPPHSHSASLSSAPTMLTPTTHQGGLLVSGHSNPLVCPGARQGTPPPASLYSSLGLCGPPVSSAMAMGTHVPLGSVTHHVPGAPSYITGSMVVPGHPLAGTLRRTMIPTSMGLISAPSPPPTSVGVGPHSGIPSATGVYYDSTIPRNLSRGLSADSTQYFYG